MDIESVSFLREWGRSCFVSRKLYEPTVTAKSWGLTIGDSESFAAWDEMFRGLKARGLRDVDVVISDNHHGLRDAIGKNFVGATWQRCQVHVMRNFWSQPIENARQCCRSREAYLRRC